MQTTSEQRAIVAKTAVALCTEKRRWKCNVTIIVALLTMAPALSLVSGLVSPVTSNKEGSLMLKNLPRNLKILTSQQAPSVKESFDQWKDYEALRTSELEAQVLDDFFATKPHVVAGRLAKVSSTLFRASRKWRKGTADAVMAAAAVEDNNPASGDNFFAANEAEKQATAGKFDQDEPIVSTEEDRALDLCAAVSSLGPVAVKIGQTLSQRPDIVGHEAARALLRLQTQNLPFSNELAYHVIRQELNWTDGAPISPGIVDEGLTNPLAKPLFEDITKDPVACASLGQVYQATLYDGRKVAVKVQRPDAMSILAQDSQVFRKVFFTRRRIQKMLAPEQNAQVEEQKQDIGSVIDRVSKEILKELDYELEARNSVEFRNSLEFLGCVTTPDVVWEMSSKRVLVTEWIPGNHLSNLSKDQGLQMTRMAVEACTASMCLTGFMHCDPHEGNLMLHEDGRVVFLDFGLMSRVDDDIMEGFARGIQALLSEDWPTLAEAFVDVGFVSEPIMHRARLDDTWASDPKFGIKELGDDLSVAMDKTEGGKARFGSLATVLNKEISPYWLVYTPPYVLLLVRTFLTLEGIAAKIDPLFNIYEMAMPWAIRRSLSPSTQKGIDVFRSTIMTDDNRIQWSRFLQLANTSEEKADDDVTAPTPASTEQEQAKKDAMKAAVGSLLGNPQGRALRRLLRDLDSTDLLNRLSGGEGLSLLRTAVLSATAGSKTISLVEKETTESKAEEQTSISLRPVSESFRKLQQRESKWRRKVGRILLWTHLKKQFSWRGLKSTVKFSTVVLRISALVIAQQLKRVLGRFRRSPVPVPAP